MLSMTLPEFQALDKTEQANAVWAGRFVSNRVVDDHYVQLYDLDSFYVEVVYDPLTNKIITILPGVF